MSAPIVIGRKFDRVIWLLLKSWMLGLAIVALVYAVLMLATQNYAAASIGQFFGFISGAIIIFVLCFLIGLVITIPLVIVAGTVAYAFTGSIAKHPWISTIVTTVIGAPICILYLSATINRRSGGVIETFATDVMTLHSMIFSIAICASTAYFCFKLCHITAKTGAPSE